MKGNKVGIYENLNDVLLAFVTRTYSIADLDTLKRHGVPVDLAAKLSSLPFDRCERLSRSNAPLASLDFSLELIERCLDISPCALNRHSAYQSPYSEINHAALRIITRNFKAYNFDPLNTHGFDTVLAAKLCHTTMDRYDSIVNTPKPIVSMRFDRELIDRRLQGCDRELKVEKLAAEMLRRGASSKMVITLFDLSRLGCKQICLVYDIAGRTGRPRALTIKEQQLFTDLWYSTTANSFEARLISVVDRMGCPMIGAWNYIVSMVVNTSPDRLSDEEVELIRTTWTGEKSRRPTLLSSPRAAGVAA